VVFVASAARLFVAVLGVFLFRWFGCVLPVFFFFIVGELWVVFFHCSQPLCFVIQPLLALLVP
jgi:hypothetical protein